MIRIYLAFLALAWFLTGCQESTDPLPSPTPSMAVASPYEDLQIPATPTPPPVPAPPPQPTKALGVEPWKEKEHQKDKDEWEAGGPGELPKPAADQTIPYTPKYSARLESYTPYQSSPQLDLPTPQAEAHLKLPDLYTLPPYDLRLVLDVSNERAILRFSNSIANIGPGALELRGNMDSSTGVIDVSQRIFTNDTDDEVTYQESGVGQFYYHDDHEHWHWEGFSLYEVYSVLPDGSLGELIYSSDKVGYCLRDDGLVEDLVESNPSRFPNQTRRYQNCGPTIQGLSSGWADIYAHDTPGQWVDVSGLAEGEIYALRSTADPYGLIHEVDPANNSAVVLFRIHGSRVERVESDQLTYPEEVNE
jgi:hypothetical protein